MIRKFILACLLALGLVGLPQKSFGATCTWSGGTGNWDNSNTASWSCGHVPVAADTVVIDGTSGAGTITVCGASSANCPNGAGVVTVTSITAGAMGMTLDFATNNPNTTASFISFSGTGVRTINCGSGNFTVTTTSGTPFDNGTTTSETLNCGSAAIIYSATTASIRTFAGGGKSYGSLTVSSNASRGIINVTGANTFGTISSFAGTPILFPQGTTNTITNASTLTGTQSLPIYIGSNGPTTNAATISVGGTNTWDWVQFFDITKAGAGSISATSSLDLGGNTGITITPPVTGSAHIIGGGM